MTPWQLAKAGKESSHQVAIFAWANMARLYGFAAAWDERSYSSKFDRVDPVCPQLALLFHVPNGGERNLKVAAGLKAQGVKPGVPDLCLPVPKYLNGECYFHGLYIELKTPDKIKSKNGGLSDEQIKWREALQEQGYCATVAYGWIEACKQIEEYLT